MDDLERAFYTLKFRENFLSVRGMAFQDWFARLAGFAFGSDFVAVRPYGSKGDLKCDGRRVSTKTIFACYAPYVMKDLETVEKVDEDFHGAKAHWGADMEEWVFVHNDTRGLPAEVVRHLEALKVAETLVAIDVWTERQLLDLALGLETVHLETLFGIAPSMAAFSGLVMADLLPVIDVLERADPDVRDPPTNPPTAKKLEFNSLSEESAIMLKLGRRKEGLVRELLKKSPQHDLGERIAEGFRRRYANLKALGLNPDDIFGYLLNHAGMTGGPRRIGAALAVLSYFFDSCDIFEDPMSV